jgi:phospholipid-binding lipoprotein MlaA
MLLNTDLTLQHISHAFRFSTIQSAWARVLPLCAVIFLAGCAAQDPGAAVTRDGISDPFEERNRNVHEFNKAVDRAVLRPLSRGYTRAVPEDLRLVADNFASNLSAPGLVVNNLLQGNFKGALTNTYRFAINSTIGFAGLVDVGDITGVPEVDTDFGETLHVWGAKEGHYVELPFRGPSTQRDAVGHVVDLFTNPLSTVLSGTQNEIRIGAQALDVVADRGRFGDTIDSVLYDSADSYAQSRLIYLQNRRFTLGRSGEATYDDPYASGQADAYDDPYEDPYEE